MSSPSSTAEARSTAKAGDLQFQVQELDTVDLDSRPEAALPAAAAAAATAPLPNAGPLPSGGEVQPPRSKSKLPASGSLENPDRSQAKLHRTMTRACWTPDPTKPTGRTIFDPLDTASSDLPRLYRA